MGVGIAEDESEDGVLAPRTRRVWDGDEGDETNEQPPGAYRREESSFLELPREEADAEVVDYAEDVCWNGEEVGVERRESTAAVLKSVFGLSKGLRRFVSNLQALESESEVCVHGSGGDEGQDAKGVKGQMVKVGDRLPELLDAN